MLLPAVLLVTAFIVYGSLYPWQFHAATVPGSPLVILLHSWSFEWNRYLVKDTAVNIVLYMPFGAACYLWLAARSLAIRLTAPLLLALTLSSSMEMIQLFDAQRFCSMVDVVTNVSGAALGIALATRFRIRVSLRPETAAPLFLLACWVGAFLFPFMPDLSTHHFNAKLLSFTSAHFSFTAFFGLLVMWLTAARLMEAATDRYLVPVLLFVLPARFFVEGVTLAWTDCVPPILALFSYFLYPVTDKTLAALSMTAIVATGLSPFHFSATAQQFSWVPFHAIFSTDWQSGFAIFFRKCFTYGSVVWLFEGGLIPTLALSALLAAVEVVQLWLPNHTAESTDPIHALLMAWVLNLSARGNQRPANASVRL